MRLSTVSFDGGHQCGLFTANECAGTQSQVDIEIEIRTEKILAQQSVFSCLTNRNAETIYGDWILCTNVDITLICADCVSGNSHCLQHAVRVTFQNGTVHERTRVTFVGVTAYVLLNLSSVAASEFPLLSGWESGTATASQSAVQYYLNDIVRRHLSQGTTQCFISASSDIFIDILRIDHSAVAKCDTGLSVVELEIFIICTVGIFFPKQVLGCNVSAFHVLPEDDFCLVRVYFFIEYGTRVDYYDWALCAETLTSGLNYLVFLFLAGYLNQLFKTIHYFLAVAGMTSGTAANHNKFLRTVTFYMFRSGFSCSASWTDLTLHPVTNDFEFF